MGMAASQARWISLAARKSNVEYEGQQINQARTALANQSSELWNKLYDMDVPTAPSSNDYTKTQYTFQMVIQLKQFLKFKMRITLILMVFITILM